MARAPGVFGAAAIMLAGAALPALACSPAFQTPSTRPETGEACSVFWAINELDRAGLGQAQPLQGGFVLQPTFEGNFCNGSSSLIVSDCNSGRVVILGEQQFDLMRPETTRPLERLEAKLKRAAGKGQMSLTRAEQLARGEGLSKAASASQRDSIRMMGKRFALNCGCRTFFPGSGAASTR